MDFFLQTYNRIIADLEKNLPPYLAYHNSEHTKHVLEKAIFIAGKQKVSEHDLFLIKMAAIYHDTGYQTGNKEHEIESTRIARAELNSAGFKSSDIDQICGMIMATKIPQKPNTILECILADADLEYLGTSKFEKISNLLYLEIKYFRPDMTLLEWYKLQIDFFSNHHYHTRFCKRYREPYKNKNLNKLKELVKIIG